MHPVLRKFSKRRPRTYGLILLVLGAVLAQFGEWGAASSIPIFEMILGIAFGIVMILGIAFLVLGSKFNPDEPSSEEIKPRAHPGVYGQPMTIDELQGVLRAEKNIEENVWAIEPESVPEGVLGLKKIEDGRWQVILNERGFRLINRTFQNESDACRFFLKSVLDDDTFWTAYQVPIVGSSYQAYLTRHLELLARYGFTRGEGDTQFWYFLIFVILFLGISIAPLLVWMYVSFLWGVMARLAYILGWVFFGFSKVWSDLLSRYGRFIEYRFGWGTVGLAVIVYWFCGGLVGFFYVVSFAVYLPAPARVTLSEGINYIARNPALAFLVALLFCLILFVVVLLREAKVEKHFWKRAYMGSSWAVKFAVSVLGWLVFLLVISTLGISLRQDETSGEVALLVSSVVYWMVYTLVYVRLNKYKPPEKGG